MSKNNPESNYKDGLQDILGDLDDLAKKYKKKYGIKDGDGGKGDIKDGDGGKGDIKDGDGGKGDIKDGDGGKGDIKDGGKEDKK